MASFSVKSVSSTGFQQDEGSNSTSNPCRTESQLTDVLARISQQIETSKKLENDRERRFYAQRRYKAPVTSWTKQEFEHTDDQRELWMGAAEVSDRKHRQHELQEQYMRLKLHREKQDLIEQHKAKREVKEARERKRRARHVYLEAERLEKIFSSRSFVTAQKSGPSLQHNHFPDAVHRTHLAIQQQQEGGERERLEGEPSTHFLVQPALEPSLPSSPAPAVAVSSEQSLEIEDEDNQLRDAANNDRVDLPEREMHRQRPMTAPDRSLGGGTRVARFNESQSWYQHQFPSSSSSLSASSSQQHLRSVRGHRQMPARVVAVQHHRNPHSSSMRDLSVGSVSTGPRSNTHTNGRSRPKTRVRPQTANAGIASRHVTPSIGSMWHGQTVSLTVSGAKFGSYVQPTPSSYTRRPQSSTGLRRTTKPRPFPLGGKRQQARKQVRRPTTAGATLTYKKKKRPSLQERVEAKKQQEENARVKIARPNAETLTRYKLFRSNGRDVNDSEPELLMSVTMNHDGTVSSTTP